VILQEMLGELRGPLLRDVSGAQSADEEDLLWSDEVLVRYINDGYQRFCELSMILEDATSAEATQIVLQADVTSYPLHQSVISVASAVLDGKALRKVSTNQTHGNLPQVVGFSPSHVVSYRGVSAYIPDYNVGTFHVIGTPAEDEVGKVINLRVVRLPLVPLTLNDVNAVPEIHERYHLDILEWAAFRALRNHDNDAENMAKASAHSTRFERAVEEAKRTHEKRTFVGFSFIPSWRW
jgi:hypothetical protein